MATDDITEALLFNECLPAVFLLASEALLLASEALLLASEAPALESEALLLVSEVFLLVSEILLLESELFLLEPEPEPFLLASEAFFLKSETFLLEAEALLLVEEASFLEVEALILELEALLLDLETFFLEAETIAIFLNFGPEDIFTALEGTRFSLKDGTSCFDLSKEPLLVVIICDSAGVFLLANFLGFAEAIILDDFGLLETFLFLLIDEEVDFRCILLDLDLPMFLT